MLINYWMKYLHRKGLIFKVKYSYEEMNNYCNEMQTIINKMNENLENINEIHNKLDKNGYWTGRAYQYYSEKLMEITNQFEQIHFDLQNSILYLQQVAENYSSTDRQIIMKLSNLLNITERK